MLMDYMTALFWGFGLLAHAMSVFAPILSWEELGRKKNPRIYEQIIFKNPII
jgi:hypothetical protein